MTKIEFGLLDDESATKAIETVSEIAEQHKISWALAGGLAVILYGSDRLTKDVDIIATRMLPLESEGTLIQGGERYRIAAKNQAVAVDWIVRKDEAKIFYQNALKDAVMIDDLPILTPEWLVILKYIAGRFKDQEDCVFLLSKKGLVNRKKIKELVRNAGGDQSWIIFRAGIRRWYDLADGKTTVDERNLKKGYIDS